MPGLVWWVWAAAAAVIALAEMHAPGSYLIWIALGAALTAAIEVIGQLRLEGQIISFAACSALSCVIGYYVYRGLRSRADNTPELNQRDRSMVGARGIVSTQIINGQGKVRVGDTVWLAEGPDLAENAPVVVTGVHGARLIVAPGKG